MNTIRLRHLIAVAGLLTASAILGAPAALSQPVPCDPAAQPGSAACASPDSMYGPVSGSNPGTASDALPDHVPNIPPGLPGSGLP